jgi:peptidyl-prolyl cis-trans isomerase SurA
MKNKIIATLLVLFSLTVSAQKNVIDAVIAVVGDEIILKSDIENQYYQIKTSGQVDLSTPEKRQELRCQILEQFLFQKLLLNQAKIDSLEVSETEVQNNLDRRINYFIQQIGSQEKLEQYFGKTLLEIKADLKEDLRNQMLIEKEQNQITKDIDISPKEVKECYNKIPKDSLKIFDRQYEIAQIVIKPQIDDREKWRIRKQLEDIREKIINGGSFEAMARLYSDDLESAKHGGDLGWVGRTILDPDFAKAAFALKNPGDISRIVQTKFGFHIIKLVEKEGDRIHVKHILIKPEISDEQLIKAKNKLDSIRNLILKDTLTFEQAAEKFSEDEQTKYNGGIIMNSQTGLSRFTLNEIKDPTMLDLLQKMKEGDISSPFLYIDPVSGEKSLKIIKVVKIIPPHKANLKEDYQYIKNLCLNNKKQEVLDKWVKDEIKNTYIKINSDKYKKCKFNYNWLKTQ